MKNIDPEKSNSNQPPQIYICLVVSLSPQWLLICSKKKKINGRPLTPVLLQQSLSKPQTQPWLTTHSSSPPLQHHLRWWFSSSNLPLTGISILTRSQLKHLPLSSIFRNLKELKLPSSFVANPSHYHLSTSLPDLSEPNSQTHSSIYHSGLEALHNQTQARCRKSLIDLVADLVIPWVLGCCLALKFSLLLYPANQVIFILLFTML